jgi:hypothetical protein
MLALRCFFVRRLIAVLRLYAAASTIALCSLSSLRPGMPATRTGRPGARPANVYRVSSRCGDATPTCGRPRRPLFKPGAIACQCGLFMAGRALHARDVPMSPLARGVSGSLRPIRTRYVSRMQRIRRSKKGTLSVRSSPDFRLASQQVSLVREVLRLRNMVAERIRRPHAEHPRRSAPRFEALRCYTRYTR